jgi:hypothetical protein
MDEASRFAPGRSPQQGQNAIAVSEQRRTTERRKEISMNLNQNGNYTGRGWAARKSGWLGVLAIAFLFLSHSAFAANSDGCVGGAFTVTGAGAPIGGTITTTIAAADLTATFHVQGRYLGFDVDPTNFAVLNYTLTGVANSLDITGGRPTTIFASKTPTLGVDLAGNASVQVGDGTIVLQRNGPGVSMKIQASDCAQGGIFQMEPERADGANTTMTHVLATGIFYFDNPNFRNPPPLPQCVNGVFNQTCFAAPVKPRINFANDVSRNFVGRDSPQSATEISQSGTTSVWSVQSGGRMGGVLGEDSTEVSPPAPPCTHQCRVMDQGKGRFVNLGFPFPVPPASRFTVAVTALGGFGQD